MLEFDYDNYFDMDYLVQFITIAFIHFLALVSPGPDFAMIARNSLIYSKRTGVYSAMGLALGMMIHIIYSIVGIGYIISRSILLFSAIKLAGAAYLIYIGAKAFRRNGSSGVEKELLSQKDIGKFSAIKMGFLTNILNPKVTIFFLSLFTQFIDPGTPFAVEILYGAEMVAMTFLWFSFVALMLSRKKIKERFSLMKDRIEKVFGAVLILLGIKVALSNSK